MKKYLLILILIFGFQFTFSQQSGITPVSIKVDSIDVNLYQESHALLIGVSKYSPGWPDLPGVKKDIQLLIDDGCYRNSL